MRHRRQRPHAQQPLAQRHVGLQDVVAPVEQQALQLRESLVDLAAGDGHGGDGAEAAQPLVVVTRERLLEPLDAVLGQRLRGRQRPVERPVGPRKRRVVHIGLVGVRHDRHPVADGLAHRGDLGDVLGERLVVDAELDRAVPLVAEPPRVVGPLRRGAVLPRRGVRRHGVAGVAEHPVDRQPGDLAQDVPQRDLDEPDGGAEVRPQEAQRPGVLLDPERILADQFARHPRDALFLGAVEFVAGDPGDARVGVDAEVREPDLCFDAPGRPRRMERLRQRDVDLARADLRDAHGLPPQGGRGNGVPRPRG